MRDTYQRGKIQLVQGLQRSDRQELVFHKMTSFAVEAVHNRGVSDQHIDVYVVPMLQQFGLTLLCTVKQQMTTYADLMQLDKTDLYF